MDSASNLIWHYTSTAAFVEIIKDDGCLYASHSAFVNDKTDSTLAAEYLCQYLKFQNIAIWKIDDLARLCDGAVNGILRPRYVTSFSLVEDDLSQWRAYSSDGGYAMGFDLEELKHNLNYNGTDDYDLKPCQYVSEEYFNSIKIENCKELESFKSNGIFDLQNDAQMKLAGQISRRLNEMAFEAMFYKNKSFEAEQEVRFGIIYNGLSPYHDMAIVNNTPRVAIKLKRPINQLIKKVIVAPHKNSDNNYILANLLKNKYSLKIDIVKSSIPYVCTR